MDFACISSTFITTLYYTFEVINQIWDSPLGDAFKEWYKKINGLPKEAERKKEELLKIN